MSIKTNKTHNNLSKIKIIYLDRFIRSMKSSRAFTLRLLSLNYYAIIFIMNKIRSIALKRTTR